MAVNGHTKPFELASVLSQEQKAVYNIEPEVFGEYAVSDGETELMDVDDRPPDERRKRVPSYSPSVRETDDNLHQLNIWGPEEQEEPEEDEEEEHDHQHVEATAPHIASHSKVQNLHTGNNRTIRSQRPTTKLSNGKFPCPLARSYTCNKTFSSAKDAKRHIHVHVQSQDLRCAFCGKLLSRKDKLKEHLARHEKGTLRSTKQKETDPDVVPESAVEADNSAIESLPLAVAEDVDAVPIEEETDDSMQGVEEESDDNQEQVDVTDQPESNAVHEGQHTDKTDSSDESETEQEQPVSETDQNKTDTSVSEPQDTEVNTSRISPSLLSSSRNDGNKRKRAPSPVNSPSPKENRSRKRPQTEETTVIPVQDAQEAQAVNHLDVDRVSESGIEPEAHHNALDVDVDVDVDVEMAGPAEDTDISDDEADASALAPVSTTIDTILPISAPKGPERRQSSLDTYVNRKGTTEKLSASSSRQQIVVKVPPPPASRSVGQSSKTPNLKGHQTKLLLTSNGRTNSQDSTHGFESDAEHDATRHEEETRVKRKDPVKAANNARRTSNLSSKKKGKQPIRRS